MFERYYQELLNFCTRALRDREAAADLVQESYARVLALQQSGQPVPEPRALLYRTARNLQIDQHRRGAVRAELSSTWQAVDEADEPTREFAAPTACEPETVLASGQAVEALLATIENLPLRCREAFVLHKFDGLPHAEVAQRMGISRKMVEQHIALALQACRRCREGQDLRAKAPLPKKKSTP
ncbi:sigma-70 family RNA polymerase sigma factor [Paucibacter sp. XJ19-41]|uniref:sigma-70 family RNA polymerase sigma factor n=1 Tax=Paucibacter sp. XJ19-41 TaxID=2927824 RepID=UPI00234BC08E|nr:sigma-70 family RNA polymerase sigma factor [Paucibacter sp. XJ19-41]MDC6168150.1 sigma-70 family RNA polymerase sigma factor [Paucibacter sp. XJ19-41]